MVVYGCDDTMRALEAGTLETILIFENIDYMRLKLRNKDTESFSVLYVKTADVKNPKHLKDGIHGIFIILDLEMVEC